MYFQSEELRHKKKDLPVCGHLRFTPPCSEVFSHSNNLFRLVLRVIRKTIYSVKEVQAQNNCFIAH